MYILVFLVLMLFSGMYLMRYWNQSFDNKENYHNVHEIGFPEKEESEDNQKDKLLEKIESTFDYPALLEVNADCIGWLNIKGTEIDYPVVQTDNNSYYLNHNFQKEYAICGTLFLDQRCRVDAIGEHLIIYGHQMKDGSMFKQLMKYKNTEFCKEHEDIEFYLKDKRYQYKVIAVYVTNINRGGKYYDFIEKETRKEQIEYLQSMAVDQVYRTEDTVQENDELLSLSTCEYSSTNGRLIVLAKRVGGLEYGNE